MNVKKLFLLLSVSLVVAGCGTTISIPSAPTIKKQPQPIQPAPQPVEPTQQQPQVFRLAPNHWADVQDIRNEAVRLSREVGKGTINKVQAAQELNQFRLALVGSNVIDDNVYDVYLRGAVGSQSGQISSAQSKQLIQTALEVWQNSWPSMQDKPDNPAFTNFLMQTMGMTPLQ
ncbi:MAG: prokaryotic membrane lipolipid attachment site family protein [Neisseriaceae bacterium]|nr:prokaryotic membrane lipolipid attachment site family protein [Neisseriaceae bacterium]MBQ1837877.1 prokaryotic membrane lipolipid attachment site family protein [Neisseriaceae bacterium]